MLYLRANSSKAIATLKVDPLLVSIPSVIGARLRAFVMFLIPVINISKTAMASCNDMKYFCLGKVLSICGKKIKKNHYKYIRKLFKRESQPISDTNACAQVRDRLDQEIKIFHLEDRLFSFRLRIKKKITIILVITIIIILITIIYL